MLDNSAYTALPAKESTDSKEPLLSDDDFLYTKQSKTYKWLHWIFHGISFVAIVALSIGLYFVAQTSRTKCWDMFNYYCKITH